MPKVLLKFNAAVLKEIPLTKDVTTVGRKEDNDIVIDNPAVSGHHCKIYVQSGAYFVDDLNSTNGTFLNDKKIIRSRIQNNDTIGIVKHALIFLEDQTPAPAQAASSSSAPAAAPTPPPAASTTRGHSTETGACITVLSGLVDKPAYEVNGLSTYIGKSQTVQVPIKGLFAPEVAAMIAKRPEGYFLIALKENYPKHNGVPLKDKILLTDGDEFEISGTLFRFSIKK